MNWVTVNGSALKDEPTRLIALPSNEDSAITHPGPQPPSLSADAARTSNAPPHGLVPRLHGGGRLDVRARRTMRLLYRRLLELGLWRHIRSVGGALTTGAGGAQFTTEDNRAFLEELLATGRFCRDTPRGGMLHRGLVSVREIADGAALHLSLSEDNRIYVHIDDVSPAIESSTDHNCRYDRARSLAHMRREVFPLVAQSYRGTGTETKNARRARLSLYDAQRAWCEAVQADRTEESLEAGVRLAGLLVAQEEGARKRARKLYQEAIDSAHEDFAPAAALGLGMLLEEWDQYSEAQEAYERALESDHSEFAPWGAYNLGMLFERINDLEGAKAAYERAIRLGHPEITSWAALNLGDLQARVGNPEAALQAYELLVFLRHPELASAGALNAARLHKSLGQMVNARAAYRKAIALGPHDVAHIAADELQRMDEATSIKGGEG
jgi:tetratricopeptide (TPR) repeat protein